MIVCLVIMAIMVIVILIILIMLCVVRLGAYHLILTSNCNAVRARHACCAPQDQGASATGKIGPHDDHDVDNSLLLQNWRPP